MPPAVTQKSFAHHFDLNGVPATEVGRLPLLDASYVVIDRTAVT